MAHYNESWNLPPLVGSCYMYGPQAPQEVTANDFWKLMLLKSRRDNLQKALDIVFEMSTVFVMSSNLENQLQAARLDSCCALLRQVLKVIDEEISTARWADKYEYLPDET
jgi:hypothetical protein